MSCITSMETALRQEDSDIVHFLYQEGFVTQQVHDEVLDPKSMLNRHQKAGILVTAIKNHVELDAEKYHILVNHLRQSGKRHESIVKILDEEYSRQGQAGNLYIVQ